MAEPEKPKIEPIKKLVPTEKATEGGKKTEKSSEGTKKEKTPEEKKEEQGKEVETVRQRFGQAKEIFKNAKKENTEKKSEIQDESKKMREMYGESGDTSVTSWEKSEVEKTQVAQEKAEKGLTTGLSEKHDAETILIQDSKTLEGLDPEAKKSTQRAMHLEFVRTNVNPENLNSETKKSAEKEVKDSNPDYDKLPPEKQKELIMKTKVIKNKVNNFLDEYEKKIQGQSKKPTPQEIEELAKKSLGLEEFDQKIDGEKFLIPESEELLKKPQLLEAALTGLSEHNFSELLVTFGDELKWENIPDAIKTRIQLDPSFRLDETKLPKFFREELDDQRASWREEKKPEESDQAYLARIQKATGVDEKQMGKIASRVNKKGLSPFVKFLADLLAPIGALMGGETGDFWRQYLEQNPDSTQGNMYERFVRGAGGGGEVNGSMAGYSAEVQGEITSLEQQSIDKIHKAFKGKVPDPIMQEKLLKILERHAKNNPNFSANQPFLGHDVGTKQGFVYFPDGSVEVCPATHGYAGIGNIEGKGGTSLGSKLLAPGFEGGKLKHRTIVKGLESCNANDEQRLVRVHEWRGSGTKTAGCSGLPDGIAARLKEAVKVTGGGAQEVFNSSIIQTQKEIIAQGTSDGVNPDAEKAQEAKEKVTKVISYTDAKKMIESGAQPTDPPTIYKIDMSAYDVSDRYKGNTDPSKGEDAAHRNLNARGKEFIAVHGTASSDVSGFHMMLDSGLFPYFVSQKGLIFQGADDMTTGSAVSTKTANPNMQKYGMDNFNNRGIAIEVSLAGDGKGGIVRPNESQKKATNQLISILRGSHDIGSGNVITSADPVRDLNSGVLLSGAHGDDFTDEDRKGMGIALSSEVRTRMKEGRFFTDELATNDALKEQNMASEGIVDSLIDQIKQNESGNTNGNEGYAWWNSTEKFPSLGFAHFIWGTNTGHGNSFHDMMNYISQSKLITVPAELKFLENTDPPSSWKNLSSMQGDPKYSAVTDFLSRNDVKKAGYDFIRDSRLYGLRQKLSGDVLNKFNQLAKGPKGAYILIDYVNFKGEGLTGDNPWGLKQVLEKMSNPTDPVDAARKFRDSAQTLLAARADSGKYIAGWTNRLNTYI